MCVSVVVLTDTTASLGEIMVKLTTYLNGNTNIRLIAAGYDYKYVSDYSIAIVSEAKMYLLRNISSRKTKSLLERNVWPPHRATAVDCKSAIISQIKK